MIRIAVVVAALIGAAGSVAAEQLPSFPKGTSYREARRSLIGLGYAPVTLPDADKCSKSDERCQGRPEMASCSGTGLGHCLFVWKSKRDMLIEVITVGESENTVSAVRCRANCR
ncbi:hypothetical protein ACWIGM_14310 [Bosea sp. NPDC055332]